MREITKTDCRTFLRRGATGAGGLWVLSLQEFRSPPRVRLAGGKEPLRPRQPHGGWKHRAAAASTAYETEDSGDCGFYKFVPNRRGRLATGGRLYMLCVKNQPNADLGLAYPIGTTWDVRWVRIDDPTAATMSVFQQGFAKGGARFRRLEGAWWGDGTGFFLSTNGGVVGEGQVFEYNPRAETIRLIYDSPTAEALDNPDNITVTPRGGLLLCEDAAPDHVFAERLIGLTLDGKTFTFAINNVNFLEPGFGDPPP